MHRRLHGFRITSCRAVQFAVPDSPRPDHAVSRHCEMAERSVGLGGSKRRNGSGIKFVKLRRSSDYLWSEHKKLARECRRAPSLLVGPQHVPGNPDPAGQFEIERYGAKSRRIRHFNRGRAEIRLLILIRNRDERIPLPFALGHADEEIFFPPHRSRRESTPRSVFSGHARKGCSAGRIAHGPDDWPGGERA